MSREEYVSSGGSIKLTAEDDGVPGKDADWYHNAQDRAHERAEGLEDANSNDCL